MASFAMASFYEWLPIPLQNAACSYYGWREGRTRFGREFRQRLAWLKETEHWSAEQIASYQDEQIKKLVRHAYDQVPFYRQLMRARNLKPEDVQTRTDLVKLPILTKEDVRANVDRMVARNANRDALILRHTSGTTGKSLPFYVSRAGFAFQWAIWWRHRARFGVEYGERHVNYTGKPAVPSSQSRPPFWRWNLPQRQFLINMHHLTPEKIASIIGFLNDHPVRLWTGYPSIIHAAVMCAQESGLQLNHDVPIISPGAENTLAYQKRDIEAFTRGIVIEQYGLSEGCGNASQCQESLYHEDFEYGVLECVDPEPLSGGRVKGQLICTGFANSEFPFIRYQTGDSAIWSAPGYVCSCGRNSATIEQIEGRTDDYVITQERRRLMRFDYVFKETDNIRECQILQHELGAIVIRVVRRPGYTLRDEQHVRAEIAKWISPTLRVDFEYVQMIERERNGKFRAVRSFLPPKSIRFGTPSFHPDHTP